ncbi:hypothetical protein BOX15_Mlig020375g3 [Macrostomum lignano]|uniref:INVERT_DEFENSINS domain-containing protein n=2 Tax=Macrostomum lignano TaxID=282301 RepID=A0A1I8H4X4_9PLAT|nr:hypothetical protein BOX15_Mlig020375g1 [Macrostomum lignano]PAA77746.1 hypothetical protein BOX15_Mlig020375g3 [Macrostomum lignano]
MSAACKTALVAIFMLASLISLGLAASHAELMELPAAAVAKSGIQFAKRIRMDTHRAFVPFCTYRCEMHFGRERGCVGYVNQKEGNCLCACPRPAGN